MSIPDRFYRIAKHKLGEVKDWFDKVDEEEDGDTQPRRPEPRPDARRELNDALSSPPPTGPASSRSNASSVPVNPPRPNQPAGAGYANTSSYNNGSTYNPRGTYPSTGTGAIPPGGTTPTSGTMPQPDPLDYHYKLLGLQAGADFGTVQAAYNKLAARSDPARFPAGSVEQQQAQQIRQRLDASFKQLRDTLDSTASRFNLLEFDDVPKPKDDKNDPNKPDA